MEAIKPAADWQRAGDYTDIRYEKAEGIAKITINRPEVRNAFRPVTVKEMRDALNDARDDHEVGVIILTGEGPLAFCSGGDQSIRGDAGYKEQGKRRNAPECARFSARDSDLPQARHCDGGRLGRRRRARSSRHV